MYVFCICENVCTFGIPKNLKNIKHDIIILCTELLPTR